MYTTLVRIFEILYNGMLVGSGRVCVGIWSPLFT